MGDVLVRLQPISDKSDKILETLGNNGDTLERCSFFYYNPCAKSDNEEFIYFDSTCDEVTRMSGA